MTLQKNVKSHVFLDFVKKRKKRILELCTQLIRERLHWLPVPERVTFKLAVLAYKCISGRAPDYLASMCTGVE